MRTHLVLPLLVAGCMSAAESHGVTAKQYAGSVQVAFINASPDRMCGLYLSDDNEPEYGDNWLPEDGLPVGKTVDLKIKPGKYKARWNSCSNAGAPPAYSATLVGENAVVVEQDLQLYAFVSDGTPPTKRAVPRRGLKLVKFIGQTTEIAASR